MALWTQPPLFSVDASEAPARLRELLAAAAAREKVVIIHEQGKAVAALISPADLARLRRYDAQREADFAVIERMREAFKDVPDDELEREVAKALAEVRAEMRAEREQAARTA